MKFDIRPLTPDLAEDYARFFDVTPHDVNIDEHKCYCVTWRADKAYADGNHWYETREERRRKAIEFIKDGSLQGYLAYHDGNIVGWCNANADCKLCVDYLRAFWPIEEHHPDVRVKSVFCFMIAPNFQREGVATQLLEAVCRDAADGGYDFVEAYVNREFVAADHDFRGPLEMYKKCGFYVSAEREGRVVVRRSLKSDVHENARFLLRPVEAGDSEALLSVYSDKAALPLFNSDNCHGDDFHYTTPERMAQAIAFWLESRARGDFTRYAILEKPSRRIIGTVELFNRRASDYFDHCIIYRLDLESSRENRQTISAITALVLSFAPDEYGCTRIASKAIPAAVERRAALTALGFAESSERVVGHDGTVYGSYFIRE